MEWKCTAATNMMRCRLLAYEIEISSRKVLEAFLISSENPAMSDRNEHIHNN